MRSTGITDSFVPRLQPTRNKSKDTKTTPDPGVENQPREQGQIHLVFRGQDFTIQPGVSIFCVSGVLGSI